MSDTALRQLTSLAARTFDDRQCSAFVVYGSFAREATRPESDIDALAVSPVAEPYREGGRHAGRKLSVYHISADSLISDAAAGEFGWYFASKLLLPSIVWSTSSPPCDTEDIARYIPGPRMIDQIRYYASVQPEYEALLAQLEHEETGPAVLAELQRRRVATAPLAFMPTPELIRLRFYAVGGAMHLDDNWEQTYKDKARRRMLLAMATRG